jgi:hypothetical protein
MTDLLDHHGFKLKRPVMVCIDCGNPIYEIVEAPPDANQKGWQVGDAYCLNCSGEVNNYPEGWCGEGMFSPEGETGPYRDDDQK